MSSQPIQKGKKWARYHTGGNNYRLEIGNHSYYQDPNTGMMLPVSLDASDGQSIGTAHMVDRNSITYGIGARNGAKRDVLIIQMPRDVNNPRGKYTVKIENDLGTVGNTAPTQTGINEYTYDDGNGVKLVCRYIENKAWREYVFDPATVVPSTISQTLTVDPRLTDPILEDGAVKIYESDGSNDVELILAPPYMETALDNRNQSGISYQLAAIGGNKWRLDKVINQSGRDWIDEQQALGREIRIDPTLTLQPDAAAGVDTRLIYNGVGAEFTNYGTSDRITLGDPTTSTGVRYRQLISFDTGLSDVTVSSSILSFFAFETRRQFGSGSRDILVHRVLPEWAELEATWYNRLNATTWGTEGAGDSGVDIAGTPTDTVSYFFAIGVLNPNAWVDFDVTADTQGFTDNSFNNWGWRLSIPTAETSRIGITGRSSDYATASERPKLVTEYTVNNFKQPIYFFT